MAVLNEHSSELVLKIAYHGPGLGGKTTNLSRICQFLPASRRGDLLTLDTLSERTLFFDFLLLKLGKLAGLETSVHLYTVPGQSYYDASRKLILRGSDALVYVADSRKEAMKDNSASLDALDADLRQLGLDPRALPRIVQFNKRDLKEALPLEELQAKLNPSGFPHVEAVARHGFGVMETLHLALTLALGSIQYPGPALTERAS